MRVAIVGLLAVVALAPAVAQAASIPDPTSLKNDLANPTSGQWIEADPGVSGEGSYDAPALAKFSAPTDSGKQTTMIAALSRHGFVTGYGRIWAKSGGGEAVVEQILVFGDATGATSFYGASKLADLSAAIYVGTVDTSSIPNSYGVEDKIGADFSTAVVFHKGNDVLVVGLLSATDYLASETVAQGEAENALAPAYTILPAPRAVISSTFRLPLNNGEVLILILGIVFVVGVVYVVISRSRRPAAQAMTASGAPSISLSPDGRYWWDGMSWNDALAIAPAHAMRSPDGAYWWDGQAWRAVPNR